MKKIAEAPAELSIPRKIQSSFRRFRQRIDRVRRPLIVEEPFRPRFINIASDVLARSPAVKVFHPRRNDSHLAERKPTSSCRCPATTTPGPCAPYWQYESADGRVQAAFAAWAGNGRSGSKFRQFGRNRAVVNASDTRQTSERTRIKQSWPHHCRLLR